MWWVRLLGVVALVTLIAAAENWPQFRGPRVDGTSAESLGDRWRLIWKASLPGPGYSSPIVWDDLVFVTAFEPETSLLRQTFGYQGRLVLHAFHRNTGSRVWQQHMPVDSSENAQFQQRATPTLASDGQRVYALTGSFGVVSFGMQGLPGWTLKMGPWPHHMGVGGSPVISGDRLLVNLETDGPSYLYAIDRVSGRVVWRSARRTKQAAYATPVVWDSVLVVAGHESLTSYRMEDGREVWNVPGLSTYVVPTPVVGGGLLYATSSGPGGQVVLAVRPSGEVAWRASRGAAYVASPVYVAGRLYTVNRNCVVSCLNASNGQLLWQHRLPGGEGCDASPVSVSRGLIVVDGGGQIHWLETETAPRSLRRENVKEPVRASPAISQGTVFIRSDRSLFAFATR